MKTLFWIQGLSCGANTQSFLCIEQKDLEEKEIPQDIHIHF
jgi:hypothetical protein